MTEAVIYGASDAARRVWEAIVQRGTVEVVAFVDDDPRHHGRQLLGRPVHPPQWLGVNEWDVVAVAGIDPASVHACSRRQRRRVIVFPVDRDDEALARAAAAAFPDPLAATLAQLGAGDAVRIGIFGTGAAGMKVWEALADVDDADAAWFADNDPRRQQQTFLWLPVIAPADIPAQRFDAIVIGSMSRDAIARQLQGLGVPSDLILAPDVAAPVSRVREQLACALDGAYATR